MSPCFCQPAAVKLSGLVSSKEVDKASTANVVDEPDVDLTSVSPRLPASWFPKKKIMLWLNSATDREWLPDDRKKLLDKFHPLRNMIIY